MLYLDNSATTQILPEVKEAMLPYLLAEFGNPSSKYYELAVQAKEAVNTARKQVANLLGCESEEVVFTSGATESNNMILKGIAQYYKEGHIITSKAEHPSVLETCKFLETQGFSVTYLDVDSYGRIDVMELERIIDQKVPLLVSLYWGNNELGSLHPIEEIAKICEQKEIFFHTDATQVVGKLDIDISYYPGIRFLSCSAHKFHGPKGIGVAVIRKDKQGIATPLVPLLHGGEQERGYRSGTLAVHNIVGLGKAAEVAKLRIAQNNKKLKMLEEKLLRILNERFGEHLVINNDTKEKIPGLISVQFKGVNNEVLIRNIAPLIAASTGSACSSSKPSHVLSAAGKTLDEIRSTVRFSLSAYTSEKELDIFTRI